MYKLDIYLIFFCRVFLGPPLCSAACRLSTIWAAIDHQSDPSLQPDMETRKVRWTRRLRYPRASPGHKNAVREGEVGACNKIDLILVR